MTGAVTVMNSLAELPAAGWDEIAYDDALFAATPWLAVRLSDIDASRVAFLGVEGADRALVAGLPTIQMKSDDEDLGFLKAGALLGLAAAGAGIRAPAQSQLNAMTMPSLLCGGRQAGSTLLLLRAGLPIAEVARHTTALVRASVDRAAGLGLRSIAFLHVDAENRTLRDSLLSHGFAEFATDVTYRLDLGVPSFDGYLAGLAKDRRRQVRRDLRALAEAEVRLDTLALPESPIDDLARLMVEWETKYGIESDIARRSADLRELAEGFGTRAVVFSASIGGELAGFSVSIEWKGHLYSRIVGFDYGIKRDLPLYFSTNFYQPIGYAETHGCRVIHYGQLSGEAKIRRGCSGVQLYGYVRCLDNADHATISQMCAAMPTR